MPVEEKVKKMIDVPAEMNDWIVDTAEREGISQAAVVRRAVEAYRHSPQPLETDTPKPVSENGARSGMDFDEFCAMMGYCADCKREIAHDIKAMGMTHVDVIRKAINAIFVWFPHSSGCPTPTK